MKWTLLEHQQNADQRPSASLRHPGSTNTDQQSSASQAHSIPGDHPEPQPLCKPGNPQITDPEPPEVPCEQSAHSRACEQHPELVGSANSADVELLTDSRQGLALLPEAAVDSIGPLPGQQSTRDRASVRHSKSAGNLSSADVRLLGGCLRGACPLPEAEVQSMAERAGMRWVQRRGTLLARTLIAQTPQVCVQAPI